MRSYKGRFALMGAVAVLAAACTELPNPGPSDPRELGFDVRILRDTWGVPHIFGRTDADVAFGLAYAHAEDDYATIEVALLAARGRLAEKLGREAVPNDFMVALLGISDAIDAGYEEDLSPKTHALLEGYAAGFNYYARLHPDEVSPGTLPISGRDIVAGFVHKAPLFFGIDRVLRDLIEPGPSPAALPTGSNAIAVAPSRSSDGRTRLAINSHQPWEGPVAWYEVHLHSEEGWDMVGGVFPGAPIILHGHNRNLGWALTVNAPDLIDVYDLDVDPDDPDRYRFDGEWRNFTVRKAAVRVKLWGPLYWTFSRNLLESVHGPAIRGPYGTRAIRYAGRGDVRVIEQWYAMNKARNFDEWRTAMRMGALPMFNTVYADREGNISYVYNALLPRRAEGYDWGGVLPGDVSATVWTEYLDFDELPSVTNPASGFVINSNSSPFRVTLGPGNPDPGDYPENLGIERSMTNRALRSLELFGADDSISASEFEGYKFDLAYSPESDVADLVGKILDAPRPEDPLLAQAFDTLAAWDLRTDPDNTSAAIGVLTLQPIIIALRQRAGDRRVDVPDLMQTFERVARELHEAHGRVDVPWHEVNRLVRGDVDLGLGGGPDILHAVYGGDIENGRVVGKAGDCYVLLVEWGEEGVRSRSIHQYGSATLDEDSPHYADQAPLFVRRELKPVWFDEAEIRSNLEREYRPGQERRP